MIEINLDKAKRVFIEEIRCARSAMFPDLDIAYQRETEKGAGNANVENIVALKQQLRDAPEWPEINNATSINELIESWPPFLGKNPFLPVASEVA